MVTAVMPQEVPPCGRIGCDEGAQHRHDDWTPGDRVVIEPKVTTAPGWTWRTPRGVVVVKPRDRRGVRVMGVQLDGEDEVREIAVACVTREGTFDRRGSTRSAPKAEHVPRRAIKNPEWDEPTLGDWLAEERAAGRQP